MRPPICSICRKRFQAQAQLAGLIYFKLSEADQAYNATMKAEKKVGHPRGRDWFCNRHYPIAKAYKHLVLKDALPKIKIACTKVEE